MERTANPRYGPRPMRRALSGDRSVLVTRSMPLLDVTIRSAADGGDGRTVDAYAAVFGTQTEIWDEDGHYNERNDPHAFDRSIVDRRSQIFCVYNHARSLGGTSSDMWSVPLGEVVGLRADAQGLLTSTRYNKDESSERILEAIRSGSLKGMSYTGVFIRSDPDLSGPFERYGPDKQGTLPVVTRQEIALIEYGPTPIPAFETAQVLAVRSRESITLNGDTGEAGGYGAGHEEQRAALGDGAEIEAQRASIRESAAAVVSAGLTVAEVQAIVNAESGRAASTEKELDMKIAAAKSGGGKDPNAGIPPKDDPNAKKPEPEAWDPDGDGDDDSNSSSDTDNSHWSADGTQLKDVPGRPMDKAAKKAAKAAKKNGKAPKPASSSEQRAPEQDEAQRSASVDTTAWDGSAAMSACLSADNPASAFSAVCAGRRSGNPKEQKSWALPHHKHPGAPPNAAGVSAALGRFGMTNGLNNSTAAKAHLETHARAIAAAKGEKSDTASTSSSGRTPIAANATSRAEAGAGTGGTPKSGPPEHPAPSTTTRSPDMTDRMTVAERAARQTEIRVRLAEIDTEFMGLELPAEYRTEWKGLQEELASNEKAIADASERAAYLATVQATGETEGVDNSSAGYGSGNGSGYTPPVSNNRTSVYDRSGGGISPALRNNDNVYDIANIRNRARSYEELPVLYREYAMRAIEQARFPSNVISREEAQGRIARLLDTVDDENGTLARRILVTGSPLYDRAFGKTLAKMSANGLTQEESRALALGTDSLGGFAVPFQLDPTVILTSNGVINPLRQIARIEQITGKEWDGVTSAGVTVSRAAEGTEASSADATLVQPTVRTTRVQGFVPFNIELDVSWGALRSTMTNLLMDAKDIEEASSFMNGNGTAPQANGLLTTLSTASNITTNSGTTSLQIADIYNLENAMAPRFRAQSSYISSKTVFNVFRQLFQQQAAFAGDAWVHADQGQPARLNGYPAYEASPMPTTLVSGNKVFVQGDFKQFLIVDRVGMGIELIPHLFGAANRYPTGQRGILAIWFNNSKVLVDNAFRALRVGP